MILHADGNSFYAACEQIYRPDLRGKPVAVLSNNDGIIIALNSEAKKLGLHRGDVYFKVKEMCRIRGIEIFSSNYTLYADISRRVTSIYMEYAPEIEEYSIDESFLFFDHCDWTKQIYEDIGRELKERIWKEVGIPICVGGGPTKTLAKLYNKKAKLHGGVYIYDPQEVDDLLEATDCETIWGVGFKRCQKLEMEGIKNALQLKNMDLNLARKLMTSQGVDTVRELNGIRCIDKVEHSKKDVITSSRQFSKKVYDIKTMEAAVVQYSQLAVERLRQQNCEAKGVMVYISTCNYYASDDIEKYSNGAYAVMSRETSYTPDIVQAAIHILHRIFRKGYGYKTVMITLIDLHPAAMQGNLWVDPLEDIKKRDLMKVIDKTQEQFGRGCLSLAKGYAAGSDWEMKRELLSPCYTTRINDAPHVK